MINCDSPLLNAETLSVGILGGTFDPIHNGHIWSAKQTQHWLALDKLMLLPAHIPPHKNTTVANAKHRRAMVNLVCNNDEDLILDDRELNKATQSFSVNTLQEIKNKHPNWQLFFIIGMDSLLTFTTWHQWQKILTLCHLVVNTRPGYAITSSNAETDDLLAEHLLVDVDKAKEKMAGYILLHNATDWDISSSMIRHQLKHQQNCDNTLAKEVKHYINLNKLYR